MITENLAVLSLQQLPGTTPAMLLTIHRKFGGFSRFIDDEPKDLPPELSALLQAYRDGAGTYLDRAQQILLELKSQNVAVLTLADADYPRLLREIHRPPVLLYVRGDSSSLALPQIAIVGSRHASRTGAELAEQFATTLAASGFAIVSGMALGIDGAAHRGALKTGKTIGVLGTGIGQIYPRSHNDLFLQMIEEGGTLVTEFPPGCPARAENFPRRNRIISGLSLGVLVVEAAVRSGSLITARCAMEQGREVFAIPGAIHNPRAKGCHQLIRDGAALVETAGDIVNQIGGLLAYKQEEVGNTLSGGVGLGERASQLLAAMDFAPMAIDNLAERSGLEAGCLLGLLVELELQGLVENSGGRYSRIK